MSETISIKITTNADKVSAAIRNAPKDTLEAIARAMDAANEHSKGIAERERLSFSKDGPTTPEGLRTVTGRLRQAGYVKKAEVVGNEVRSIIGNNVVSKGGVNYAAIHEFGFVGSASVGGFNRKRQILEAYKDKRGANRKRKAIASSAVKAHTRSINFPARAMYSRSIHENLPDYQNQITNAVIAAWEGHA